MRERHFRNAAWGGFSAAIRAVYGVLNALLALRLLGLERYGLLATLFSFFALYLSLNVNVFTIVVVNLMATKDDLGRHRGLMGAAYLAWVAALVLLAVIIAIVLKLWVPDPPEVAETHILKVVLLMAGMTALQISTAFQAALLESMGGLHIAMKLQMASPFVVVSGLLGCFMFFGAMTPEGYLGLLTTGALLDFGLLWNAKRSRMACDRARVMSKTSVVALNDIFRSAGLLQAASMMNLFLEPLNKLLLNHFLGSAAVSIYDLAMKVIWGIQNLFSAAMRVFLHIGSQQSSGLGAAFVRVLQLVSVPALLIHVAGAIFLAIVGHDWLHIPVTQLLMFYGVATLSNLAMIFVTPLYIGLIGRQELVFVFRIQAILAVTNVLVSLAMIPWLGLIGAALGLLVATLYNVSAIVWKCRTDIFPGKFLVTEIHELAWRFFTAIAMMVGALLWGAFAYDRWWLMAVIMVLFVWLGGREPLTRMFLKRFFPSGWTK